MVKIPEPRDLALFVRSHHTFGPAHEAAVAVGVEFRRLAGVAFREIQAILAVDESNAHAETAHKHPIQSVALGWIRWPADLDAGTGALLENPQQRASFANRRRRH